MLSSLSFSDPQFIWMLVSIILGYGSIALIIYYFIILLKTLKKIEKAIAEISKKIGKSE